MGRRVMIGGCEIIMSLIIRFIGGASYKLWGVACGFFAPLHTTPDKTLANYSRRA